MKSVEETSSRDAGTPEEVVPTTSSAAPDDASPPESAVATDQDPPDEPRGEASVVPIAAGPPPETVRTTFADLGLSGDLLRAIEELGYRHPTPVQEQAIPFVLMGRDVMGVAQTGTGKTAGFTLPMLDILTGRRARARMPRSLILEPTRELALQVAENFQQYGKYLKLTHALIIGGESVSDQKDVLMRGVDVLIATPGRLLDMFERGSILLSDTGILVIDEADRMLDMGFIPDVERIVSLLPPNRQTLFFSATMGPEIRRLADAFLRNPKEVTVSRSATVATTIVEGLALVAEHDKREALRRMIRNENVQNALIFCNRKTRRGHPLQIAVQHRFSAGALHGDMAQTMRFATLEKFKAGELRLLVCSDVAARGLDIGGLSHVFNFDVPIHAEDYVHRIGRTGRAGLEGHAFTIADAGRPFRGGGDREADRPPDPADASSKAWTRSIGPSTTAVSDAGGRGRSPRRPRPKEHRRRTSGGAKPERKAAKGKPNGPQGQAARAKAKARKVEGRACPAGAGAAAEYSARRRPPRASAGAVAANAPPAEGTRPKATSRERAAARTLSPGRRSRTRGCRLRRRYASVHVTPALAPAPHPDAGQSLSPRARVPERPARPRPQNDASFAPFQVGRRAATGGCSCPRTSGRSATRRTRSARKSCFRAC